MTKPATPPSTPPCRPDAIVSTLLNENKTLARENLATIATRLLDLSRAADALCDELVG